MAALIRQAAFAALPLLLALLGAATPLARAECLGEHGGLDGDYTQLLRRDPGQTMQRLHAEIDTYDSQIAGNSDFLPLHYAILADAYDAVGRRDDAREALRKGLTLVSGATSPRITLRLRLRQAGLKEDTASARSVLQRYEAAAAAVAPNDPYYICMLVDRGYLRYRAGEVGPSINDLSNAFALARTGGSERDRIDIGSSLSLVYQSLEFFDEAIVLADAAIDYYRKQDEPFALADAYYRRGRARTSMRDYAAAEPDLRQALLLATQSGDAPDAFYAQVTLCDLLVGAGRYLEANSTCEDATRRARGIDDPEGASRGRIMQAEILLAAGRAAPALSLFNAALAEGDTLLRQRFLVRALRSRAKAFAALGDFRSAFADVQRSQQVSAAVDRTLTEQKVAVLRVRFEIARKDKELLVALQDAALSEAHADRDRMLRNFIIAMAALALLSGWLVGRALRRRRVAESARLTAEQQLESLGRLAAGVAHDFNNLLTVVQQASGMLARVPAVASDVSSAALVAATRDAASTGGAITTQLLSFGRQQNLRPEVLHLSNYFSTQLAIWKSVLGEAATLQAQLDDPGLAVYADRSQLSSALINLLVNARDASQSPAQVRICAFSGSNGSRHEAMTRIELTDRGQGMRPDVLARATEPFFSTKEPGRGSGLGLSAVDGFVRQSGGRLQIRSEAGLGTTVVMILPQSGRE